MTEDSNLLHSGSVACGASNSTQQDDAVRERDAGSFPSRQQDDAAMKTDAGSFTSRQQDDESTVPCGDYTSTQPDHTAREINGKASNSGRRDDVPGETGIEASTGAEERDSEASNNSTEFADEALGMAEVPRREEPVSEIEEEIPRNADEGGEEPVRENEEEAHRNADQGREEPVREIEEENPHNAETTEEYIRERDEWVASIRRTLEHYTSPAAAETETVFIPRVRKGPRGFGQAVKKAYEPSVISIGPHHWKMPHLKNMQKRKWQCLKDIDDRCHLELNDLFNELKREENRARSFYPDESERQLESRHFLEMLLLDGFFIVDYLRRASSHGPGIKIWSNDHISNDLLLLENQLPFFVVECMYGLVRDQNDEELVPIAGKFFDKISPKKMGPHSGVLKPEKGNFKHLLHLYHAYLFFDEHAGWTEPIQYQVPTIPGAIRIQYQVPTIPGAIRIQYQEVRTIPRTIPSAMSLKEAGIKFKIKKRIDKVVDVKFEKGVMEMTPLIIDAFTISKFLNLIEFERADRDMEPRITGFLQFMDCIINTSEDVALLRKNGILEHAFGSDEEVAGIINRLTSGTFHQQPWELKDVYVEADTYYKAKWNRWWATLLRDYFGSPWATIATLAAILLLSFSFFQTFFSAASYLKPRSAS